MGPGRVGTSLAHWAVAAGGRLDAVAGRDPDTARQLARGLGGSALPLDELDSSASDVLLICVSDPALSEVAARLARLPQAAVALHTAGAVGAEAIAPLRAAGSAVGSLHPLKSFPRPLPDPGQAEGVVFGVDGDAEASAIAVELAEAWGGRAVRVPAESRLPYHLAATLASGGVVTLLAAADAIARRSGLPERVLDGYLELARGSLERAATARPVAGAITGPVARGDRRTVGAELDALAAVAPDLEALVVALARATLRLLDEVEDASTQARAALRIDLGARR